MSPVDHKCLGCALMELRAVDTILTQAVDFWTSMELVVDVVVRRKEHSETLLRHSTSARMLARATSSLQEYAAFWQAFAVLCGRYAESLSSETREMYGWLLDAGRDAGPTVMLADASATPFSDAAAAVAAAAGPTMAPLPSAAFAITDDRHGVSAAPFMWRG